MSVIGCSWQIPYSMSVKKIEILSTQSQLRIWVYWVLNDSMEKMHELSTQFQLRIWTDWVLNFNHFFVGNWVLNKANIEWTLWGSIITRLKFYWIFLHIQKDSYSYYFSRIRINKWLVVELKFNLCLIWFLTFGILPCCCLQKVV